MKIKMGNIFNNAILKNGEDKIEEKIMQNLFCHIIIIQNSLDVTESLLHEIFCYIVDKIYIKI